MKTNAKARVEYLVAKIDHWISWSLLAVVFLLPLAISIRAFDAFDLTKVTILYVFSILLLFLYFARIVLSGRIVYPRTGALYPAFLYVIWLTLCVLFSRVPLVSIVGEYGRYETFQAILCFVFLFYLSLIYLDSKKWLEYFFWALFIAATLIIIYGVVQGLGYEPIFPFFMVRPEQWGGRARSTLGNAVFLGGYLAFILPLILDAFLKRRDWLFLIFGGFFALGFASNVFSQSRGGWLGMIAGVSLLVAGRIYLYRRNQAGIGYRLEVKHWSLLILAVAVVFLVFLFYIGQGNPGEKLTYFYQHFLSIFKFGEGSAATRIEIWKSSLRMINDRPFLGVGPDQMLNYFPQYRTVRYTEIEGEMTMPDRCHNEYLQVAVNLGIPGFLAFLWLLIYLFFCISKPLKEGNLYLWGLTAALVGYLVQAITSITIVGIAAVIWVVFAILLNLSRRTVVSYFEPAFFKNLAFSSRIGLILVFLLLSLILFSLAVRPAVADYYFYRANEAGFNQKSVTEIEKFYKLAIAFNPYRENYRNSLADLYYNLALTRRHTNYLNQGISLLEEYNRFNPYFQDTQSKLGAFYALYYNWTGNPYYNQKALEAFRTVVLLDPLFNFGYLNLVESYLVARNFAEARLTIEKQKKAWGKSNFYYFYLKGRIEEEEGKLNEAALSYSRALKLNPGSGEASSSLNRVRAQLKVKKDSK